MPANWSQWWTMPPGTSGHGPPLRPVSGHGRPFVSCHHIFPFLHPHAPHGPPSLIAVFLFPEGELRVPLFHPGSPDGSNTAVHFLPPGVGDFFPFAFVSFPPC